MSMPSAPSGLGELWIDRPDARARVSELGLDPQAESDLSFFIDQGYVIIPGAVSPELADRVVADAHAVMAHPNRYVVRDKGQYVDPSQMTEFRLGHRIIDLYAVSPAAREAVFTPRVSKLLQAAFGEPAVAIQSLYFEYGSQQAIHQDTAYVVSRRPMALAAIWIALEDVEPGTGELCYYPGAHRVPHHFFGGTRKHWIQAQDGAEAHQAYLRYLHDQARAMGSELATFHARKGDVLIWHADLPHGGTRIRNIRPRRSHVLHFAPQSVKANYFDRIGQHYHELPADGGNFFSSRHYKLAELDAARRAPVLFDGGLSQRRQGALSASGLSPR
jgi:phytanoyl-CoA hydroxylase